MNFKTTYVLFGVLFAMLAVLGVVLYLGPTPPKGAENIFPSFKNMFASTPTAIASKNRLAGRQVSPRSAPRVGR